MLQWLKLVFALTAFIEMSKAQNVPGVCFCVPTGTCTGGTGGGGTGTGSDGAGQIVCFYKVLLSEKIFFNFPNKNISILLFFLVFKIFSSTLDNFLAFSTFNNFTAFRDP